MNNPEVIVASEFTLFKFTDEDLHIKLLGAFAIQKLY